MLTQLFNDILTQMLSTISLIHMFTTNISWSLFIFHAVKVVWLF